MEDREYTHEDHLAMVRAILMGLLDIMGDLGSARSDYANKILEARAIIDAHPNGMPQQLADTRRCLDNYITAHYITTFEYDEVRNFKREVEESITQMDLSEFFYTWAWFSNTCGEFSGLLAYFRHRRENLLGADFLRPALWHGMLGRKAAHYKGPHQLEWWTTTGRAYMSSPGPPRPDDPFEVKDDEGTESAESDPGPPYHHRTLPVLRFSSDEDTDSGEQRESENGRQHTPDNDGQRIPDDNTHHEPESEEQHVRVGAVKRSTGVRIEEIRQLQETEAEVRHPQSNRAPTDSRRFLVFLQTGKN